MEPKSQEELFEEFLDRFVSKSDKYMINVFNEEVGKKGWVSARGTYMAAIHKEFENRGFDYSAIGNKKSLSFNNRIKLVKKKIVIE